METMKYRLIIMVVMLAGCIGSAAWARGEYVPPPYGAGLGGIGGWLEPGSVWGWTDPFFGGDPMGSGPNTGRRSGWGREYDPGGGSGGGSGEDPAVVQVAAQGVVRAAAPTTMTQVAASREGRGVMGRMETTNTYVPVSHMAERRVCSSTDHVPGGWGRERAIGSLPAIRQGRAAYQLGPL